MTLGNEPGRMRVDSPRKSWSKLLGVSLLGLLLLVAGYATGGMLARLVHSDSAASPDGCGAATVDRLT